MSTDNTQQFPGRVCFPNSKGPRPVLNHLQFTMLVELVEQGPIPNTGDTNIIFDQLAAYGFASSATVKGVVGYFTATERGANRYAIEFGETTVMAALDKRKHLIKDHE